MFISARQALGVNNSFMSRKAFCTLHWDAQCDKLALGTFWLKFCQRKLVRNAIYFENPPTLYHTSQQLSGAGVGWQSPPPPPADEKWEAVHYNL